jgi:carboxypeptidase family protein
MNRRLLAMALVAWVCGGILALPQPASAQTVITGTVKSKDGKPLPGLALLEKGEIHNNAWDRGALVDAQGRFRIEVTSGGQYGLHVYSSGYFYDPHAIMVEAGKTLEVDITLVPEPTRANDPVIKQVGFYPSEAREGKVSYVKMDVTDPHGILGPQVLALNAATGRAYAMDPPHWVWGLKSNYPNGVYQIEVDTSQAPINPRDWYFVVADHQCNTTDVLAYPHEPKPQQVVK